jgi:hypothetical protein
MMMSKKIVALLLVVFMIAVVGGCGVRDKVTEEITEKVTEGVINKALDGEGSVDIEGGKVTIKGEDGGEYSFGDTEWPKDGAAQLLPKFDKGKISSVLNSDTVCVIMVEEVEKSDFEAYVDEVKGLGFTNEAFEFTSDTTGTYMAKKDEKTTASVQYDLENKFLTIGLEISE